MSSFVTGLDGPKKLDEVVGGSSVPTKGKYSVLFGILSMGVVVPAKNCIGSTGKYCGSCSFLDLGPHFFLILLLVQGIPLLRHRVHGLESEHLIFLRAHPSQGRERFSFRDRTEVFTEAIILF